MEDFFETHDFKLTYGKFKYIQTKSRNVLFIIKKPAKISRFTIQNFHL